MTEGNSKAATPPHEQPLDPLRNPSDPMLGSASDRQLALFRAISAVAHGYSIEETIGAIVNVQANAIRQACPTRLKAFERVDQLTQINKDLLGSHYDQMGKRRNVFPFDQHIEVPHFDLRNRKIRE